MLKRINATNKVILLKVVAVISLKLLNVTLKLMDIPGALKFSYNKINNFNANMIRILNKQSGVKLRYLKFKTHV